MVSLCGRGFDSLQLHDVTLSGLTLVRVLCKQSVPSGRARLPPAPRFVNIMKTIRFSLFSMMMLALLGLTSCEKAVLDEEGAKADHESEKTTQQNDISISKVTLLLRVDVTKADENPVSWKTLQFEVFNKSEASVAHIVQSIDDDSCGTASVQLTPGTYKVAVLAHSLSGDPKFDSPTMVEMFSKNDCSDVFYAYSVIEVENKTQEIELTLHKATSLIRFQTKDVIPEDVKSFILACSGGSAILNLGNGFGGNKVEQRISFNVADSMVGKPLQVDIYTLKRSGVDNVELTVSAYKSKLKAPRIYPYKTKEYTIPIKHLEKSTCSTSFFTDGDDDTEINTGEGGDNKKIK